MKQVCILLVLFLFCATGVAHASMVLKTTKVFSEFKEGSWVSESDTQTTFFEKAPFLPSDFDQPIWAYSRESSQTTLIPGLCSMGVGLVYHAGYIIAPTYTDTVMIPNIVEGEYTAMSVKTEMQVLMWYANLATGESFKTGLWYENTTLAVWNPVMRQVVPVPETLWLLFSGLLVFSTIRGRGLNCWK